MHQLGRAMAPSCRQNTSQDVSVEVFFKMWFWIKQITPSVVRVASSKQLKALRAKTKASQIRRNFLKTATWKPYLSFQPGEIQTQDCNANSCLNFQPADLPYRFWMCQPTIMWAKSLKCVCVCPIGSVSLENPNKFNWLQYCFMRLWWVTFTTFQGSRNNWYNSYTV